MEHMAAHTLGEDAFNDWIEARALWDRVIWSCPGVQAAYLLPTRVRVVVPRADRVRLVRGLNAYTRWRNHRRGESGPLWRKVQDPRPVPARLEAPAVRYVHREGCREGLSHDPLAWAFSTHRDAVGLSLASVRQRELRPFRFHRLTVGPDAESPLGLPEDRFLIHDSVDLPLRLRDVVSSVTRTPLAELRHRPAARLLWVQVLKHFTRLRAGQIGDRVGWVAERVRRVPSLTPEAAAVVRRCLRDARFTALAGPLPERLVRPSPVSAARAEPRVPEHAWWPAAALSPRPSSPVRVAV